MGSDRCDASGTKLGDALIDVVSIYSITYHVSKTRGRSGLLTLTLVAFVTKLSHPRLPRRLTPSTQSILLLFLTSI